MSLTRQRLVLLLIVAIAAAPLAAALLWYGHVKQDGPQATVNHGSLIKPSRSLAPAALPLSSGGRLPPRWFEHRWTLVYVAEQCDKRCRHALYVTRQVRLATGAQMNRVQRLLAVPGTPPAFSELKRAQPDLAVVDTAQGGRQLIAQIIGDNPAGARIYLVDPRARVIMSYPVDGDPKGLLDDLEHLLRYSQIG